jgi:sigma-B regulation protein RsbU (phosphoserine phosphatase)
MGLMPTEPPQIPGLTLAGRCQTVNHVGGDFFKYFQRDGQIAFCLADVTGHAMEAAIPVVMFNGILESEIKHGAPLAALFADLNGTLYSSLDRRTFVCFLMAEVDLATRTARLANSACPYPYHYQAASGKVVELEMDGYPLGVRSDVAYETLDIQLETGDRIVFCSDGIIEAGNAQEDLFGFERAAEVIRAACVEGLSAEELLDRLMGAVAEFMGDQSQGDDITCVVLQVE